jgi:hypothetical protein
MGGIERGDHVAMTEDVSPDATRSSQGASGRSASGSLAICTSSVALAFSLAAIGIGATSPRVICPPNYVQLVELAPVVVVAGAIVAVLAALALIAAAMSRRPSVGLAAVGSILAVLALLVLVLATSVHGGHLSNCWTF